VKRDGRLVGVDLAAARARVASTIDHLRETMGEQPWQRGMNPDIPETAILENPYQYTEWDAGSAQWKH
jgi:hypothetical protein